jgi:hypothetical protein
MMSGSKEKPKPAAKEGGIKRDVFRQALEDPIPPGADKAARGDTLATFASSIAGQLGIGPKLGTEAKIADATSRTADGVEQLVAMNRDAGDNADTANGSLVAGQPAFGESAGAATETVVMARPAVARPIPSAESLARAIPNPSPAVAGVAGSVDRDLVSVAERTAIATERAVGLLREILQSQPSGAAFA